MNHKGGICLEFHLKNDKMRQFDIEAWHEIFILWSFSDSTGSIIVQ